MLIFAICDFGNMILQKLKFNSSQKTCWRVYSTNKFI